MTGETAGGVPAATGSAAVTVKNSDAAEKAILIKDSQFLLVSQKSVLVFTKKSLP